MVLVALRHSAFVRLIATPVMEDDYCTQTDVRGSLTEELLKGPATHLMQMASNEQLM